MTILLSCTECRSEEVLPDDPEKQARVIAWWRTQHRHEPTAARASTLRVYGKDGDITPLLGRYIRLRDGIDADPEAHNLPTSAEYAAECTRRGVVQLFPHEYEEWVRAWRAAREVKP